MCLWRQALALLEPNTSISWGGSMTLEQIGLPKLLAEKNCFKLLDRSKVSPEDLADFYLQALSVDTYFMSSNAITEDGKLINIDGRGNRVAALIYGPKQIIIIAGMNKIAKDEASALDRIRNTAAPINAIRLNKNTPCAHTGQCHDCLSPDCICMQTVITRNSAEKNRIKVILVGENLGY